MARSERKILPAVALTVTTTPLESFDITNFSGVAVTLTAPALGAGTLKIQYCNFNSALDADWTDIPTASLAVVASGSVTINVPTLHAGFIRPVVTLSAGAGDYTAYYLAKDF